MLRKPLYFFNKKGENYGFNWNESRSLYEGRIWLNPVSTGLFENEQIFIVEKFIDDLGNNLWGKPKSVSQTQLTFRFKERDPEIFLYSFSYDSAEKRNQIERLEEVSFVLNNDGVLEVLWDGTLKINSLDAGFLPIGIGLGSGEEVNVEKTLEIYLDSLLIGELICYGEVEGEDSRYEAWTNNLLGQIITLEDSLIYRDVDPNEALPNFSELNRKRKELLVEKENIFGYIGAYRGLVNAIKHFGYDNVKLREWWKNLDYDPLVENSKEWRQTPVLDIFDKTVDFNQKEEIRPSFNWKKTNMFTLVFRINEDSGQMDEDDLPITDELTEFTIQEILIKLNLLKDKLKNTFLPNNGRIIEILGEGDFYARQGQRIWRHLDSNLNVNLGDRVEFSIEQPLYPYLQDLRPFIINLRSAYPQETLVSSIPEWKAIDPNSEEDMRKVRDMILDKSIVFGQKYNDFFWGYFTNSLDDGEQFNFSENSWQNQKLEDFIYSIDDENVPVGYPITLENRTTLARWDDFSQTWDSLLSQGGLGGSLVTWDTVDFSTYYEIEWIIKKDITEQSPQEYVFTKRGPIQEFNSIGLILPYKGIYRIELSLRDLNNNLARSLEKKTIEVKQKESDFILYRNRELGVGDWNSLSSIKLDDVWFTWDYPVSETSTWDEFDLSWESMNYPNFSNYTKLDPWKWDDLSLKDATFDLLDHMCWDFMIKEESYSLYQWETLLENNATWDSINLTWSEIEKNWTKRVTGERPASFQLYPATGSPEPSLTGSKIIFASGEYTIQSSSFIGLLSELTNSQNPILVDWQWNGVFDSFNNLILIQAIHKNSGPEFETPIFYEGELRGDYFAKSYNFNPSLELIKPFSTRSNVKPFSLITCVADNSKIAGKTSFTWELLDQNDFVIDSSSNKFFTVFLWREGEYSIKCRITDSMGNMQEGEKRGVIKLMNK